MMGLLAVSIIATEPCLGYPTQAEQQTCALAAQQLVCWTDEHVNISRSDPALRLFLRPGRSLDEAMFRLAYERVNGCDPVERRP